MTDFLGPASDTFATTTRPADSRTFGATSTWFKDCSSSAADDGTELSAEFLNGLVAQLRTVITNSGIAISPTDDTMLYTAIQSLIASGGSNSAWDTAASSATIDLGSQSTRNIIISGTTAITSFGATGDVKYKGYRLKFSGALTLTNSASLVLPTGANITTAAGDIALAIYMGAGIWTIADYNRADGTPLALGTSSVTTPKLAANAVTPAKMALGAWAAVASAATVDLGAQTSRNIVISGTTTITSFGATATADNVPFLVRFAGALTLTNSASLILPGSANITTAAGDVATVQPDSAGIWRVINYTPASGIPLTLGASSLTSSGYQKLPSGLILQWGYSYAPDDALTAITFPIAFPNASFGVVATPETAAAITASNSAGSLINSLTKTGFKLGLAVVTQVMPTSYHYWFAFGN